MRTNLYYKWINRLLTVEKFLNCINFSAFIYNNSISARVDNCSIQLQDLDKNFENLTSTMVQLQNFKNEKFDELSKNKQLLSEIEIRMATLTDENSQLTIKYENIQTKYDQDLKKLSESMNSALQESVEFKRQLDESYLNNESLSRTAHQLETTMKLKEDEFNLKLLENQEKIQTLMTELEEKFILDKQELDRNFYGNIFNIFKFLYPNFEEEEFVDLEMPLKYHKIMEALSILKADKEASECTVESLKLELQDRHEILNQLSILKKEHQICASALADKSEQLQKLEFDLQAADEKRNMCSCATDLKKLEDKYNDILELKKFEWETEKKNLLKEITDLKCMKPSSNIISCSEDMEKISSNSKNPNIQCDKIFENPVDLSDGKPIESQSTIIQDTLLASEANHELPKKISFVLDEVSLFAGNILKI
jgi:hypothetical protein